MKNSFDYIPFGIDEAPTRKRRQKMDHLTRDVLAAERAGMSYGQWKAQHPHTGEDEPAEPDPDKHVFVCKNCGGRFIRRSGHPIKYCSEECRYAYNYKKAEERRKEAAKE